MSMFENTSATAWISFKWPASLSRCVPITGQEGDTNVVKAMITLLHRATCAILSNLQERISCHINNHNDRIP